MKSRSFLVTSASTAQNDVWCDNTSGRQQGHKPHQVSRQQASLSGGGNQFWSMSSKICSKKCSKIWSKCSYVWLKCLQNWSRCSHLGRNVPNMVEMLSSLVCASYCSGQCPEHTNKHLKPPKLWNNIHKWLKHSSSMVKLLPNIVDMARMWLKYLQIWSKYSKLQLKCI